MSALYEFPQQFVQDVPNLALQLAERRNDRLSLPLTKVGERYKRGRLHVLLNLLCKISGKTCAWVACIEVADGVQLWTSQVKTDKCQRQFPVLGFSVQVMDDPQHVAERVATVIRLYSFDDLLSSVAREYLYFSL